MVTDRLVTDSYIYQVCENDVCLLKKIHFQKNTRHVCHRVFLKIQIPLDKMATIAVPAMQNQKTSIAQFQSNASKTSYFQECVCIIRANYTNIGRRSFQKKMHFCMYNPSYNFHLYAARLCLYDFDFFWFWSVCVCLSIFMILTDNV